MSTPSSRMRGGISTFEQLIAPMSAGEFLKEISGKRPLHLSGPADRFTYLLTWDALNSILSQHPAESLNISLVKDGRFVPAQNYMRLVSMELLGPHHQLNVSEITKQFRQGATLMLDLYRDLHEPISSLADVLESVLFSHVHVVAFAGWHNTQAAPTHWDPSDVFVLQLAGRKHWRVFEPTRQHPIVEDRRLPLDPPKHPYWEGDLNPGDLFYMPRGWWHDATPYSEPSLHLSFALRPATGVDLAELVVSRLKELDFDFMRANVPRHATEAEQREYLEAFRSALNAAFSDVSLARLLAESDSKLPSKARLSLPWSAAPESQDVPESAQIAWCPIHPIVTTVSERELTVQTSGSTFTFPRFIEPVLVDISNRKVITSKNLRERHPKVNVSDCILHLISAGLVRVVRDM